MAEISASLEAAIGAVAKTAYYSSCSCERCRKKNENRHEKVARACLLAFLKAAAPGGAFKPGTAAFNLGGSEVLRHLKRLVEGEYRQQEGGG